MMAAMPGRSLSIIACVLLLSFPGVGLFSQTEASPAEASPASGDLVTSTVALDIATASFYELATWASSLGLPETGSLAELRARLYEHYGVKAPGLSASGRKITIEKAQAAEYFKMDYLKDPIVRISGGVVLTVVDEASAETQRLEAEEILYDKARNSVTARGKVRYRRESADGVDEFTGATLSANLDDSSGIFLDGVMRRTSASGSATATASGATGTSTASSASRTFSFVADTMLRRNGDVIVLENGVISACDADDPHYSIKAKRLWLLDSNEWAVSDAVIFIGEVPILWLPFFFYPGEEIVFHPVFGYADREGRFVQTTTYLIGAKPAKTESSMLSFGRAADGQAKEIKGAFYKPLKDKKAEKGDGSSLKILGDVYSSLGAYLGLVASFPKAGPFKTLKLDLGLGFTRSLFSTTGGYSPYVAAGDWASVWNETTVAKDLTLPFRFGVDFSTTLSVGSLSATFALPFYSDQYYKDDFRDNRSEDMDWLGLSSSSSTTTTTTTTISSFTQKMEFSGTFKPAFLSPWISSIQLTRLATSLAWLSKRNADLYTSEGSTLFAVDPARYFFYPNLLRPIDLSLTIKGGLPGASSTTQATSAKEGKDKDKEGKGLVLKSPWAEDDAQGTKSAKAEAGSGESSEFKAPARIPSIATASVAAGGLDFSWTMTPSFYLEERFLSDNWTGPEDIVMDDLLYNLYSWSVVSGIDASYTLPGGILAAAVGLDGTTQDQYRDASTDSTFASLVKTYKLTDYKYKLTKVSSNLQLQAKPFANFYPLSSSSLTYSLEGYLYRNIYSSLDSSGNPVYLEYSPAWDTDTITTNSAALNLGLKTGSTTQSLGLSMTLPPLSESYTGSLSLAAAAGDWTSSLALGGKAYRSTVDEDFSWDPFSAVITAKTPFGLSLSNTLTYDSANSRFKTNSSTLALGGFSATLAAKWSQVYTPVTGSGWVASGSEEFLISSLSSAYKNTWKTKAGSAVDASLTVNASYDQSLLRFTESTLGLTVSLTAKITNFLDLTFSSVSQNSAAWHYWPWLFPATYDLGGPDLFYKNPVTDILDSFAFWDDSLRKASLFKLKSASVKLTHDLHDWNLSFSLTATPTLDTTSKSYYLESAFTFLLSWKDMPEIKSSLTKDSSGYSF